MIFKYYGSYANAAITEEMKYPKLLPRRVHFIPYIGTNSSSYWIPQGRAEVRCVLSQCVVCKRYGGPSFSLPNLPPWPRERVSKSVHRSELTEYWRRNQKQLKLLWDVWKQEYLLSLRETSLLRHRGTRSQSTRLPKLGEVVIVKDDYCHHERYLEDYNQNTKYLKCPNVQYAPGG